MIAALFCVLTLGWWILLGISLERDRSRYWNCYLLFIALVSTLWTVTFLAGVYQIPLLLGLFVVFTTAILIVPFFLIIDGVLMIKREGYSLANCLSLGFGIIIGIGSHVALYYWPSALIREYIAIHATRKHLIILIVGWLVCMALSIALIMGPIGH